MSGSGKFFSMPVEMANEIVLHGGHAEEVITALVLCRGAGRHSSTAWTENSVIKHVRMSFGRAKKAIHWLAEKKFIETSSPQSGSDTQQSSQSLLEEAAEKENGPIKTSRSSKRWKVHTSQYLSTTYFPNDLIDKAADKAYGPIGKLYNELEIRPMLGIKVREAQLDLIMLLLHLHAEQDIEAYGGVAPQIWHCTWLPVSDGMGRAGSNAINQIPKSNAVIYEIERGLEHFSTDFVTKTLFYVTEKTEREERFRFALKNLKKLNFFYEVLNVWTGNPLDDDSAELAYPLHLFERQAKGGDEPYLLSKINNLADKFYADRDGEPSFEQDGSLKNIRPGNFRYFGYQGIGCVALSVKRMRFRAHNRDTGIGIARQAKAVEDWTVLIEEIQGPFYD